ncbi:MAG: hypothetical protein BWY73_00918 [candidate division TA06 bacterium ADurb.Bin417]|uniref:Uncharacterized protein n=1 Tax=candidate division TA06 bacterium ADurb.Bin417 TaxID=1852828 RepID=A0A1V5MG28_UNCT6|nr:MAG: hypothetical protein BWY73_00918 [candidate division TA06 bacterium ADurb.Bin417]
MSSVEGVAAQVSETPDPEFIILLHQPGGLAQSPPVAFGAGDDVKIVAVTEVDQLLEEVLGAGDAGDFDLGVGLAGGQGRGLEGRAELRRRDSLVKLVVDDPVIDLAPVVADNVVNQFAPDIVLEAFAFETVPAAADEELLPLLDRLLLGVPARLVDIVAEQADGLGKVLVYPGYVLVEPNVLALRGCDGVTPEDPVGERMVPAHVHPGQVTQLQVVGVRKHAERADALHLGQDRVHRFAGVAALLRLEEQRKKAVGMVGQALLLLQIAAGGHRRKRELALVNGPAGDVDDVIGQRHRRRRRAVVVGGHRQNHRLAAVEGVGQHVGPDRRLDRRRRGVPGQVVGDRRQADRVDRPVIAEEEEAVIVPGGHLEIPAEELPLRFAGQRGPEEVLVLAVLKREGQGAPGRRAVGEGDPVIPGRQTVKGAGDAPVADLLDAQAPFAVVRVLGGDHRLLEKFRPAILGNAKFKGTVVDQVGAPGGTGGHQEKEARQDQAGPERLHLTSLRFRSVVINSLSRRMTFW